MSQMPPQTEGSPDVAERRQYARHQVKSLAYLDIGADNGGIVLNISESGLAVHAVSVLPPEPVLGLRIQLPKSSKRLETQAKVAWTSGSKKEAGVEFIDLPAEARLEIREWLLSENVVETIYTEEPPPVEPAPPRRAARTDKWTSLVGELTSAPPVAEPVENEPRAASRPIAFARPAQTEATLAPALAEPASAEAPILASEESAESKDETSFAIAEALTNDATELNAETDASVESKVVSPFAPPETTAPYDPFSRRSGTELSLPSETLLNTPQHPIAIVPNRSEKTGVASGSRNLRDSRESAPPEDDFLKKARALFGPRREARIEPEIADLPTILESAPEPALEPEPTAGANEVAARAEAISVAPPQVDAAPALASAASVANIAGPAETIGTKPLDSRGGERKPQLAARPTSRGLDVRSTIGIFALCVIVAVVCVGLGILVGRSVSKPSPNVVGAGGAAPTQTSLPAATVGATSQSGGNDRSADRGEPTAHRKAQHFAPATRQRTNSAAPESSGDSADDNAGNAATSQPGSENSAAPAAATSMDSNGSSSAGSATPAPVLAAPASSAPVARGIAPVPTEATPRTAPPADRLVMAHLIYRVEPFYPRDAAQQRVEGTVKIHATVAQDGRVKNLKVISGPASLTSAALDAAQYWRYIPALRNGEPVESDEEINIEFHLLH